MKQILKCVAIFAIILNFSCESDSEITNSQTQSTIENTTFTNEIPCGTPTEVTLWAGQNFNAGTLTVSNDANFVYVNYTTVNGWELQKTHLYVGDCDLIPVTNSGNPQIGQFPFSSTHSPRVTSYTYTLPINDFNECFCVAAHAELVKVNNDGDIVQTETGWAEGDSFGGNSWAMKSTYCKQNCDDDDDDDCVISSGDYRTQTQGGWGSVPRGNNPGKFLHQNFEEAFPNGLTVGCSNGFTLNFSSANAITTFLPQGGTPAILDNNYTNPTTLNNVLAGQIVALTLSVTFDNTFDDFGNATGHLEDLVITSGAFSGWTVAQLLNEANLIFGGCSTSYSASEINAALSSINENFIDGEIVGDFLTCNN